MTLPADGHVHSQFSWDAPGGDMVRSCARAVELGVPAVAFTEHVDLTPWTMPGGRVRLGPPLDLTGYRAAIDECRDRFPTLRVLSGVEFSEPHWHAAELRALVAQGFDRVLGSVHSRRIGPDRYVEVGHAYGEVAAAEVVRGYLAEVVRLADTGTDFEVVTHVDYPLRHWPDTAGRCDIGDFEEEFRVALAAVRRSGRVLELNTRRLLHTQLLGWWREAGGRAIAFGSDAHDPDAVARQFRLAAYAAEAHGFRPGPDPVGPWLRA
ncbi:PHP domain-containing protein [Asanoa siamensis]|uniref:Histidinol-phosphatase n=1 Tax=Asanoa siamensis TaxID=926357 RepID=A0ABQ4CUZ7_9ACTN|nr:PHP domain-containing protein [Asanoa siamensis]GIF75085.1 histidinol-phosphatase [Asanoa siamensis]